ncbi:hypothetical protein ABPG72_003960 [Tetrahymena utriculariae]
MSFSGKGVDNYDGLYQAKEFQSCNNTRKNSFESMNLPDTLNPLDIKNNSVTATNKSKKLQSITNYSRKQESFNLNRRTNTVFSERAQSTKEDYKDIHSNYNQLKTVGEDDVEQKSSSDIAKQFQKQVYMNTIKLNGKKSGRSSTLPSSDEQVKALQQFAVQQNNINTHFNKFFKKKIRITNITPGKQNTVSNKSTTQNSLQSSPISYQQKDYGQYNNFMIFSRKSTLANTASPINDQKLVIQIQDFYQNNKTNQPSSYDDSLNQNKSSSKNNTKDISTPINSIYNKNQDNSSTSEVVYAINQDRFSSSKIKKKFRGANGLTPQILELWINDTLTEAQSDKQFNESKYKTHNYLSSYNLDRKNLFSKGVKHEGIDRIYRCLFVYSFGFYEMLYEILEYLKEKDNIISQIWKVFGILLEYCARGEFKTTVCILEKEKEEAVETLKKNIEEKQTLIKEIEQKVSDQGDKYLLEIRSLKAELESLLTENVRLSEDNKLLDDQFNQEAKTRLQFEHKINEIYSIHRELNTKFQHLITEKDSLEFDLRNLKADYNQRTEEKLTYQAKYTQAAKDLEDQKIINSRISERNNTLEKIILENSSQNDKVSLQNKELNEELIKRQLKIDELNFQVDNLKIQIRQYAESSKRVEEKKSEMLNEKEYYEQRIREKQKLLSETQAKLNMKENQYSEISYKLEYDQSKFKGQAEELKEKQNQIYNLQKQLKGIQIDFEVSQNTIKNQEIDVQNLEKCIREYKVGLTDLEQQYIKSTKQINQMQIQLDNQQLEVKKWMGFFEEKDIKYQQLQNEYRTHIDNYQNQIQILKFRITKIEQENRKIHNDFQTQTLQLNQFQKERDEFQNQLFEAQKKLLALKDINQEQTFRFSNIEYSLSDKIEIVEELKKQNIEILTSFTEYKIKLEQTQRELASITRQYNEFQIQTQINTEDIHAKYLKEISNYRCKDVKIHSMEYEDLYAQLLRQLDKYRILDEKVKERESTISFLKQQKEIVEENRRSVEKSKSDLVSKLSKLKGQYDASAIEIKNLKQQIEYQKNTTSNQHEQLGRHFTKELQETKENYEEQIKNLTNTLTSQMKELEGQFKYTLQKNISLKEENDKLQESKVQLEDEIIQLKLQSIQHPSSPTRMLSTIQSRTNSKVTNIKESEPSSPLKSPASLKSPQLKSQVSNDHPQQISLELINKIQPIQLDKEIQTTNREHNKILLSGQNQDEISLQVLQNITNVQQQKNDSKIIIDLYKARQLESDSLATNLQPSITQRNQTEERRDLKRKNLQKIQDKSQERQTYNPNSDTLINFQNTNNSNINNINARPSSVEQKHIVNIINQRNISTAYEQLKPSERYPTDKYVKKPKLSNQELAKILNASTQQDKQQSKK